MHSGSGSVPLLYIHQHVLNEPEMCCTSGGRVGGQATCFSSFLEKKTTTPEPSKRENTLFVTFPQHLRHETGNTFVHRRY